MYRSTMYLNSYATGLHQRIVIVSQWATTRHKDPDRYCFRDPDSLFLVKRERESERDGESESEIKGRE